MRLQSVTHHVDTNTLEAVWVEDKFNLDGELVAIERVKCQSYSQEQKMEFIDDTGELKYTTLPLW